LGVMELFCRNWKYWIHCINYVQDLAL
jgi:hypothetical protein